MQGLPHLNGTVYMYVLYSIILLGEFGGAYVVCALRFPDKTLAWLVEVWLLIVCILTVTYVNVVSMYMYIGLGHCLI